MENEKIITVLTEILEDQKDNSKLLIALKSSVDQIEARLDTLSEIVSNGNSKDSNIDSSALKEAISNDLKDIKIRVETLQKRNAPDKRILLFPEHNAREYYSVIFRWLLYITIATYSYWVIKNVIGIFKR